MRLREVRADCCLQLIREGRYVRAAGQRKPERKKEYLDIAAELRPSLEKIDGFKSIERFESLYEPGKILSLSFFRRRSGDAGLAQYELASRGASKGPRRVIFADYHLRVAGVIRNYGKNEREQVPTDSRRVHGA